MNAEELQRLINYEAARQKAIPTLMEAERLMAERAKAAQPPPPKSEREIVAEAMRQVRDQAMAAGIAAGLATGRALERRSR